MNASGICFVTNAKSHRVARHGSWCDAKTAEDLGIERLNLEDFANLRRDLSEFVAQGAKIFVIEGGDGTVLAVLSAFSDVLTSDEAPTFAILPGGSTNLAYKNFGFRARSKAAFHERLKDLAIHGAQDMVHQRALSVTFDDGREPVIGFLLSTGTLSRAMSYVQREFHGDGHRGSLAVAQAIFKFLTAPHKYLDSDGAPVLRGSGLAMQAGDVAFDGDHGLSLMTSFSRLSLGINPFWGVGKGGIAVTYAKWPMPYFRSGLLEAIAFKRNARLQKKGFVSHRADEITLKPEDPIMVDGELITLPPDSALRVSLTQPIGFLR